MQLELWMIATSQRKMIFAVLEKEKMRLIDAYKFRQLIDPYVDKYGFVKLSITRLNIAIEKSSTLLSITPRSCMVR